MVWIFVAFIHASRASAAVMHRGKRALRNFRLIDTRALLSLLLTCLQGEMMAVTCGVRY
jgi:hypothetical protein